MPKHSLNTKFQPNWLSQRAVQKKDAIALIFKSSSSREAESWTYSQLEYVVNGWVERLQILGIKSGDRGLDLGGITFETEMKPATTRIDS